MGIIATVGRRSFSVTMLIGTMYFLLTAGGITMVYPFLLMLATATTTEGDMQEYRLIPAYWTSDEALYRKYLWLRYDTGVSGAGPHDYRLAYPGADVSRFRRDEYFGWGEKSSPGSLGEAIPPGRSADDPAVRKRAADLDRFLRESAALWPGPPLMESFEDPATHKVSRRLVCDPFGRPLDPAGLTTGLGNRYPTVGYMGAAFTGLSGIGRDQWTEFLDRFYTNPQNGDESQADRIARARARHSRPYERWWQVQPGYDMPGTVDWSILDGDGVQQDWLFFKATWLPEHCLRALRPTLIAPQLAIDLKARYDTIDRFNLAMGLAKLDWAHLAADQPAAEAKILTTGRDVVLARNINASAFGGPSQMPEGPLLAAIRALCGKAKGTVPFSGRLEKGTVPLVGAEREGQSPFSETAPKMGTVPYLLPPQIDAEWAKFTVVFGLNSKAVARLNDRINDRWVSWFASRGYPVAHLDPFANFEEVYVSSSRPLYEPLAKVWDDFVSQHVPGQMKESSADFADSADGLLKISPEKSATPFHLRLPSHAWRDFLHYIYDPTPQPFAGSVPSNSTTSADESPSSISNLRHLRNLRKDSSANRAEADTFRNLYLAGISQAEVDRRVRRGRLLYGPDYDEFNLAPMPIADRDVVEFFDPAHKSELRREFLFGNFAVVLNELVLEGRAMFNTLVLILLTIACQIVVNPLAAYALSRFRLKYTYKVLLFMLATMAFPPAVGMIPSFLLLKNLGLINTYAALVLPGIASGYTVFLLKGFFDALPQELYEAAEIDGAGKITTFLNVTFPLSKPIFAIIALDSFTAAYSGFMWAFLICPDHKMWTIMVHLFSLQQAAGAAQASVAMAAMVLAAVPTFLMFLFCQNVILKGIIVPSFK